MQIAFFKMNKKKVMAAYALITYSMQNKRFVLNTNISIYS